MALRDQLLASALDMAARGYLIFPLTPGAKTPAVKDWQGHATSDPEIIRKVWAHGDYNIGVKTGAGLLVVDIDIKKGKQGASSFAALGLTAEEKDTFRVKTASGGWHVYYRYDPALVFGNNAGRLGDGLDVRGDGGYVVGPGSVLTNGSGQGSYTLELDHPLAALAASVRGRLAERRPRPEGGTTEPIVDLDRPDAIQRAIDYLRVDAPTSGSYQVAARLKDFGVSKETAALLLEEHWNDRRATPHTFEELEEKVAHAYTYGTSAPGSDHPAAAFGGVDLEPPARPVQPPAASDAWRHGDGWNKNIRWLYHEALPAVGVGVVVGSPQAGKTFVCVELGRSAASGKPFFNVTPDRRVGVVFLFAGSEGSSFPMRMEALDEKDPLPITAFSVGDLSARGALGTLLALLRTESARMQRAFGVPLGLVFLETLNASGLLVDEHNNSEIGVAFANLGTLSRELDALVITTHHPPKNGEGARGGGAIIASADYVLEIIREGTEAVRFLELTKARDAEQRQLGTFTLLQANLGEDDRGRPITSMTVSMGEPMTRQGRRTQYAETFMQALEFAIMETAGPVEGYRAAEYNLVLKIFSDLKTGSKERSAAVNAFRKCFDYAKDAGAVDSAMFAGERYIWTKEITDGTA
jgi:hypothetical protein